MTSQLPNGTHAPSTSSKPIQLALPLPHAPHSRIHIHLTILKNSLLLFLSTSSAESGSTLAPMGSLVYAMPNRTNASAQPLSTALYPQSTTVDFATRIARILARRSGKPTYVGNSMSFAAAGLGGAVEEEMEGLNRVIEVVMAEIAKQDTAVNGDIAS
ncbi:hypothetical protein LTS18_003594 [Coniosporium uncinatum]|uniref:Uncharacterized protein n=1 Tax=Coniosporium uncinatum TaxID=93489 RepID=A0ACC3D758_9PEZI|nr:hypothetical protein LTS18_003594 [Coniosporium uncinatum]